MTTAELIYHGLSGEHLYPWLPGNEDRHKYAISHMREGGMGWSHADGRGDRWGQVCPDGIGVFDTFDGRLSRKPKDAIQFVRWREVFEVVARGCAGGRRERYEAAYDAFCAAARNDELYGENYGRITGAIHETTRAIIEHGCAAQEEQLCLPFAA